MMEDIETELNTAESHRTPDSIRPRWGRTIAWLSVAALLAILFFGLLRTQQGPIGVGQKAPDFTFTTFDGKTYTLSELGGKVVLVNFWASWCKPCEQEAADLELAWRAYQTRGDVVFLGLAWTDTEKEISGIFGKIRHYVSKRA